MSGSYGNENFAFIGGGQNLATDATSDTITIPINVDAVEMYATAAMWVVIGDPGETPTAAASAEKTTGRAFYLPIDGEKVAALPKASEGAPIKIAAIQATGAGVLHVTYRRTY